MIYLISDIHGNTERFRSVMDQICLQPEDKLYILGDVIDRFPGGIDLLQEIMGMSNAQMLLGNHEYMMLQALEKKAEYSDTDRYSFPQQYVKLWYRNGGSVTHEAFNALDSDRQEKILSYLKSLPLNIDLSIDGKRYKLVHGISVTRYYPYRHSIKESCRYADKTEFAVWERWDFGDPQPRDYTMICGHTPTSYYQADNPLRIYKNRHIICIDCGSGYSKERLTGSRLACLRLDDMSEFYSNED